MDMKMKVILGIFAVIVLVYVIHFAISYVSKRKKETFAEDDEHFTESADSSYNFGIKLLKLVDDKASEMSLTKKQKAEVVKDLFSRMDDLKKMAAGQLDAEVEKVCTKVKSNKSENFEDAVPKLPAEQPEEPKAPVGEKKIDLEDDVKVKLTSLKEHLKKANDVMELLVPTEKKKNIMNIPEIPLPKTTKEGFTGFEDVASYANWE